MDIGAALAPLVDRPVEYLVVFDARNALLDLARGTQDSVKLDETQVEVSGLCVAHTHVWLSESPMAGLNPNDLEVAARHNLGAVVVIYRWDGVTYMQAVARGDSQWPDPQLLYMDFMEERAALAGRSVPDSVDKMDLALRRTAQQHSLLYSRVEIKI